MIPAKYIIGSLLVLYLIALVGGVLAFNGVPIGQYLVYIAVPPAVLLTFAAGILAMAGKIDRDW